MFLNFIVMKKEVYFVILLFCIYSFGYCQNLIQNPSMEQVSSTVTNHNQIPKAYGWSIGCGGFWQTSVNPPFFLYGTPDLFDKDALCSSLCGIPNNK